jgi:hypothetical protein
MCPGTYQWRVGISTISQSIPYFPPVLLSKLLPTFRAVPNIENRVASRKVVWSRLLAMGIPSPLEVASLDGLPSAF